jgi:recombination protein RecA
MSKQLERRLETARALNSKKFGNLYVNLGPEHYKLNVVPSPSLMLDFKLGIGGFPYGAGVEIYGANRIGKSSVLGYGTLANVVKQDKLACLIAVEPRLVTPEDREWALSLGLDPEQILILYPDHAQEAFNMLRELVFGTDRPDYILIDSLGGMGNESSSKEDGKPKAYGISGEVTSGLNDIMPRLYKNNQGLMIINQQRQAPSPAGKPGMRIFESPGGEALKHHMRIRIHVKPGSQRYTAKVDDESLVVGQELVCMMRKNNMSQSQEKTARFDFFHINTDTYGFGIDKTQDMINVGKLTGVIKGGTWLEHPSFPETKSGEHKLQGKAAVKAYLEEDPKAETKIRQEVMAVMMERELQDAAVNRKKKQTAKVEAEEVSVGGEGDS